ncbi:MAG: AAA family ATPase [Candidatus Marithrix sp.]|nr:AAA family ATPase [Candidatus Marithrix sp.]
MLKRIYIDNFKCLVNFELKVDSVNLFLGSNGVGKTTLFQALHKLQQFIIDDKTATELFEPTSLTRWQNSSTQSFELEIAGNGGVYKYSLVIEHQCEQERSRMQQERLWFNDKLLFDFNIDEEITGIAQLYRDDGSKGPEYHFDWSRSGIAVLPERADNTKLTWFKKRIAQFLIVRINPTLMSSESRKEETNPTWEMSNYVAWFRYLSQDQGTIFELTQELRKILPDFKAFKIISAGEAKILSVDFFNQSEQSINYKFDELSDGQRVLIVLYTLLHYMSADYTLCLDEPENFLALPEIQPWLDELYDKCENHDVQALLISHHPKIINYLASETGYWFSRQQNNGPVRVQHVTDEDDTGLSIAELVAREWIYDD